MTDNSIIINGRYYNNEYIIKDNYAILRMIRKRDGKIIDAFIDIEEVEKCAKFIWYPHHDKNKPERLVYIRHRDIYRIHRFILDMLDTEFDNYVVDHIDRNPLNNRKSNLRKVTISENNQNISLYRNNTSGKMGVHYSNTKNKWIASIMVNGKLITKSFNNQLDAIISREIMEV